MTIKQALARQQEIVALARNEKRELNSDEEKEFNTLQQIIDSERSESERKKERERVSEIIALCRDFSIDSSDYVSKGIINSLAKTGAVPWFITADPLTAKSIQVDYLNGNEVPILRRSEKAGTLGFVWDIYLDWGINVRDYRGIVKNVGTEITE